MDILKAEYRDTNIKAKKLRRMGLVPCSIYGINLEESIHIQIPLADINRFLNNKLIGSTLTVDVGDKKYSVLYKNISRQPASLQIEHMEFQHLVADEAINSVVQIVLINKEKNPNMVQQQLEEIPYNALPSHLIEKITIDLTGMEPGSSVKVEDLDIAKNENIRLLIPEDTMIFNVVEPIRVIESEEEDEGEEAAEEETQEES